MSKFTDDITFTRGTGATRINAAGLIVGVDFSSTSNTIGTGSKTFTLTADANVNRDWPVGSAVRVVDQVSANTMEGTVTSYTPSTQALVLNIATVTGSGTFTNWRIGSLEVRRDADGVLREPMRSNLVRNSGLPFNDGRAIIRTTVEGINLYLATGDGNSVAYNGGVGTGNQGSFSVTASTDYVISFWIRQSGTDGLVDILFRNGVGTARSNSVSMPITTEATRRFVTVTANANDTVYVSIQALTTGQTIEIGGFNVEQGTVPTSYIPTTTVAVTRNADTFTFTPAAIAKFRQGQGALVIEANASDAGTAQRAALRLTGPSGEIRLGKQGVATSGNFTKMAEGGDVQLLGNATQGVTNNGLEYGLIEAIDTRTNTFVGAQSFFAVAYDGSSQFGFATLNQEGLYNSNATTVDFKSIGALTLNGCHHNGSRFLIATGTAGVVGLSTDGLSYRRVNTPVITQACNEVTSGMVGPTLRNVIVGNAGFIATSDDNGETWVSRTSGTAQNLLGVSFGTLTATDYFITAGNSGTLRYSTDAITWTNGTGQGAGVFVDVHIANNIAVAVGVTGTIFTSTNGTSWAAATSSGVVTTQTLNGVHYNASANLWVAVGNAGTIITATDPTGTWTLQTSGTANNLQEVNYFNGLWVAIGNGPTLLTSPNAVTWTVRSINGVVAGNLNGIAASGTRLIVTGTSGGFASSEDGLTYTSRTNNNATLNGIAYGAGVYVSVGNAVGGSGYIATIDGAGTVTRRVSPVNQSLSNVDFVNGIFVISMLNGNLLTSANGVSWALRTITNFSANSNYGVAFGNGVFVSAIASGRVATSSDGITWIGAQVASTAISFTGGAAFGNGLFILCGTSGAIFTSPDAITWTQRTSGTTQNLNSVIYSQRDQRWYAAGNAGTLLYSEDNGVTWASVNNAGFGAVNNITLQANKLLPQWKTGRNTMALSYKANEVIVGLNGVAVTDTANTIPSITAGVLGESFNGKIKSAKFQPNPLTAAEVVAITGVTR